jgi:phosphocarrier protein
MGVTVVVDAQGDDADQALNDIQALFDAKFGENE